MHKNTYLGSEFHTLPKQNFRVPSIQQNQRVMKNYHPSKRQYICIHVHIGSHLMTAKKMLPFFLGMFVVGFSRPTPFVFRGCCCCPQSRTSFPPAERKIRWNRCWNTMKHGEMRDNNKFLPWEPTTLFFRGYNPYFWGLKPSFFMGFGVQG